MVILPHFTSLISYLNETLATSTRMKLLSPLSSIQIMDYASLPHFCRKEGSGSSRHIGNGTTENCFSLDHAFHQRLYNYIKQQAVLTESVVPIRQGSFHVDFPEPDPEGAKITKKIESEFHRIGDKNGLINSLNGLKVDG